MPNYKNMSKETVLQAIEKSYGVTSTVAARLGVEWNTARKLINRWAETKQAWDNENETVLDIAESKVYKSMVEGDIATAKWVLSRKGKARGWEDTPTIKLDNGEPLNIKFDGLTPDAIAAAANVEVNNGDEEEATDGQ